MADNEITQAHAVDRLDEAGIPHVLLPVGADSTIVVCERGARIFGPFVNASTSLAWMPAAFRDRRAFEHLVASGHWNLGGERIWIGPEIQYMIPDRDNYWGTYTLPAAMDPGTHTLDTSTMAEARLRQHLHLRPYRLTEAAKALDIAIHVQSASDPLRYVHDHGALVRDVSFAGYRQTVTISETTRDAVMSESWNLLQLNPGGKVIVPCATPTEISDYYEPVDSHLAQHAGWAEVTITGARRFKIGFKSAHVSGRLGYLHFATDGIAYLLVRSFYNDPSSNYTEEPDFAAGQVGDSTHIYNDDGALGGFGELEARGRAIGATTGRSTSTDEFTTWCYRGPARAVRTIARQLLGPYNPMGNTQI